MPRCCLLYTSPEAAVGGPIALVEEGDIIKIDIPNMKLELDAVSYTHLDVYKRQRSYHAAYVVY